MQMHSTVSTKLQCLIYQFEMDVDKQTFKPVELVTTCTIQRQERGKSALRMRTARISSIMHGLVAASSRTSTWPSRSRSRLQPP